MMDNNVDALLSQFDREIADLTARDNALSEQESLIKQERDVLKLKMAQISQLREGLLAWAGRNESRDSQAISLFSGEASSVPEGTIAEMAYAILRQHGGRMKVQAILEELIKIGKLKGGRGDYGTLYGTLSRDTRRFRRMDKGVFAVVPNAESQGVLIQPSFG